MQFLKLLLSGSLFDRIAGVGDNLTSYVDLETRYAAAILSRMTSHAFAVVLLLGVAFATLLTLLIAIVIYLLVVLPLVQPSVDPQIVAIGVGSCLTILLVAAAVGVRSGVAQISRTYDQYRSHWSK